MRSLGNYSIGIGDRFGRQGQAQLRALTRMHDAGVMVTPVWNKSNREHQIVHTTPQDVRTEADAAVQALQWRGEWFVDADHVNRNTVAPFIPHSDFFTLDVAEEMGHPADAADADAFADAHPELIGSLSIPGLPHPRVLTRGDVHDRARRLLRAVQAAGDLYHAIHAQRGNDDFITEVSMDETDYPQTPEDLLVILAALSDAGVPVRTLAPKFSGRFNKGVDYVGDVDAFTREFEADLCVLHWCRTKYNLPADLKLSIHSGSDKFALYGPIRELLQKHAAGVHLKTAGTTWLEEIIGLAEAGGDGTAIVRDIYRKALRRFDEMCAPYAMVIDIERSSLPDPNAMDQWTGAQLAAAIRHQPESPYFNPNLRQFMHVAYKIAAELGRHYTDALDRHAAIVNPHVEANLFERHLKPLFQTGASCDT